MLTPSLYGITGAIRDMKTISLYIIVIVAFCGCAGGRTDMSRETFFKDQLITWNQKLTQVIITDVLTPPVCARAYAYTNVAAYEGLRHGFPGYPSYASKLNDLKDIPAP